eukprot:gene21154-35863_t
MFRNTGSFAMARMLLAVWCAAAAARTTTSGERVEGGLDRDLCCPHMLRGRARKVCGPHTPAALEREEPAAVRAVPLAT